MKGLMVTLLVLSCTGMAQAQQDYNSNGFQAKSGGSSESRFNRGGESKAPIVPIVGREGSDLGPASATSSPNANENRRTGTFGARGDNELATGGSSLLKPRTQNRFSTGATGADSSGGFVPNTASAPIGTNTVYLSLDHTAVNNLRREGALEAPVGNEWANRITISDRSSEKAGPRHPVNAVLQGDTLVFQFTENELSHLKDWSFEFDVPNDIKGKFNSAIIEYPPTLQRIARANSNQTPIPGSGFRADDSRWRLAGDTTIRQPRQSNQFGGNANQQSEVNRQRMEYEKWLREKEDSEKLELANENRKLQERLDRMRFEQQQATLRAQQNYSAPQPRYAENRPFGSQPLSRPVVPPLATNDNSLAQTLLQRNMLYENRIAQLELDKKTLSNNVQSVKMENDYLKRFGINKDAQGELAQNRSVAAPRNLADSKPTVGERAALSVGRFELDQENAKNSSSKTKVDPVAADNGWKLMMFLILMISVGLNLYLWALSRGFYLRYQELADELRETFTVTV